MISANVLSGGIAGALSMALGVQRVAPGIGIFDPLLGLMYPATSYYLAFGIGLALNVLFIIVFKTAWLKRREAKAAQQG